jgi:type 1 glutamine amidotransferase
MAGLPPSFTLRDELYHVKLLDEPQSEILAETSPDKSGQKRPSIWVPAHPNARIICIAPGHDQAAHNDPNFQRLLQNAVHWAAQGARK